MDDVRFIHSLSIKNFLSYGENGDDIELNGLNVIIGPNGSGKSNLIEALGIIHALPTTLSSYIRQGGGAREWFWKGHSNPKNFSDIEIEAVVAYPDGRMPLRYKITLGLESERLVVVDEFIENEKPRRLNKPNPYFLYRYNRGYPVMYLRKESMPDGERQQRSLRQDSLLPHQSVLAQRKDPDQYPELTYLGNQFPEIRFYREWNLGRYTAPRIPQRVDLPEDFLLEDASNLGLVINNLQHRIGTREILNYLKLFYESIENITTRISGGTVQIFLHEAGLQQPIPATRLSDGTLRYLCLLTLLLHPDPPPLICIEEPELGLHPDILPTISELLMSASQRTQLVVTTHSDAIVSALSDMPESVLVCERNQDGSYLRRLGRESLQEWLEDYTLDELWSMGEIGGTRW